jgi:hypothetical protein
MELRVIWFGGNRFFGTDRCLYAFPNSAACAMQLAENLFPRGFRRAYVQLRVGSSLVQLARRDFKKKLVVSERGRSVLSDELGTTPAK